MVSTKLVIYCLLVSGIYLLLVSFLLQKIEQLFFGKGKLFELSKEIPEQMIEKMDFPWFITNFLMEFLFFAVIPSLSYSFFYVIFPLSGIRAAAIIVLTGLIMGALPLVMSLVVRIKFPMHYLLYLLLSYTIKFGGSLAIIGYLYTI